MARSTRRTFLASAATGLALGVFGGCARAMQGDIAPRSGRRVVVIGGGAST